MVYVRKTYGRVRGGSMKIAMAAMIVVGFIRVLFLPSIQQDRLFGHQLLEGGVAHADVSNCNSCGGDSACSCTENGDSNCGDGGDGCADSGP